VSVTTSPDAPAMPFKVTNPVDTDPPMTLVGDTESPDSSIGGASVSEAVLLAPPDDAVITATVLASTNFVVMEKVAVVDPPETITNGATIAAEFPLIRLTTSPPVGAALDKVTVPVELEPLVTVDGLRARLLTGTVLTSVPIA